MISRKVQHGQYFTKNNPFYLNSFKEWFDLIPKKERFLEPFAGSNNLLKMISEVYGNFEFGSFDIEPPKENLFKISKIIKQDTLKNMPEGYDFIVTNPPYLAKNSSTRKGLKWHENNRHDDLYKFCLEKMLDKYNFVAAIIPESFIVANLFHDRLYGVISLTQEMFSDTDCPVCIALFTDIKTKKENNIDIYDFKIWQMEKYIGTKNELNKKSAKKLAVINKVNFIFNDKNGPIGLFGVDNTKESTIKFVYGKDISSDNIKVTSRAITRISINFNLTSLEVDRIISRSNEILEDYRNETQDVFMTAFKGLRQDGKYRRRLDFATAERILNKAIDDLIFKNMNIKDNIKKYKFNQDQKIQLKLELF